MFYRLSQGHLNLLEICPPKFQQTYLENLPTLTNPEQEDKLIWGSHFHLLMQQRELGLPLESLLQAEPELDHSLKALIEAAPDILNPDNSQTWREAEHSRTLNHGSYLLTVVYDLLIANQNQAQIIDWKTYLQPPSNKNLAHDWQTRLYLYVLAETSEYAPEQISLTYWFVKLPQQPQNYTFTYSADQHTQTKTDLTNLLTNLDYWLLTNDFPHQTNCEKSCPFRQDLANSTHNTSSNNINSIETQANLASSSLTSLDQIAEISI
ncbi:MAG TPA: PD-(D/E)XK nuclease family protein [Xenococcaceae cyanobacterium]|jgi:hypothetical protein